MNQVFKYQVGDVVPIQATITDSVGMPALGGVDIYARVKDVDTGMYLDFHDQTFKSSGWVQDEVLLPPAAPGLYVYRWDTKIAVRDIKVLIVEFRSVTIGWEFAAYDTLIFGLADVVEAGKWEIVNNQMLFFRHGQSTPILKFDLFDGGGIPAEINVKRRERA